MEGRRLAGQGPHCSLTHTHDEEDAIIPHCPTWKPESIYRVVYQQECVSNPKQAEQESNSAGGD